jgi:putative ubiquitin-RnfH superfamily antitoxin RatB of RatAB toxin-antitoxin module
LILTGVSEALTASVIREVATAMMMEVGSVFLVSKSVAYVTLVRKAADDRITIFRPFRVK